MKTLDGIKKINLIKKPSAIKGFGIIKKQILPVKSSDNSLKPDSGSIDFKIEQPAKSKHSRKIFFFNSKKIIKNLEKRISRSKDKQKKLQSEEKQSLDKKKARPIRRTELTGRELIEQKKEEEKKIQQAKAKSRAEKLKVKLQKKEKIHQRRAGKKKSAQEKKQAKKENRQKQKNLRRQKKIDKQQLKKENRQKKLDSHQLKKEGRVKKKEQRREIWSARKKYWRDKKIYWQQKLKKNLKWLAISVAVVIVAAVGSLTLLYKLAPVNEGTDLLLQKLRLPIVLVNYRPISYNLYSEDKRLLLDYYRQQPESENAVDISSINQRDIILEKLVAKNILENLASKYNIKVMKNDLDYAFADLAEQNGGTDDFTEVIYNDYGLAKDLFINKIIYYNILSKRIKSAFINDDKIHRGAFLRMDKVVGLVNKNKESFEDLARKYSEDVYALKGGDIGYVNEKNMDEDLLAAVNNLEIDQTSDILKTEDKYYIVRVYDKKTNRREEMEYWLKKISIDTNYSFDAYLQDLRAEARVWVLLKL